MKTVKTILSMLIAVVGLFYVASQCNAQSPWEQKTDIPTRRFACSTSVVDGKIYAIGGSRGYGLPLLHTVEEYDPATDTWTQKADMPTAREMLTTSVVNGKIYAIGGGASINGGYAQMEPFSTVEEYDPATDTWTTKSEMPTARTTHCASVVDGKIYVLFGSHSSPYNGPYVRPMEVYDPATDTWIQKGNVPANKGGGSTSVVNGKIYAFGGYGSPYGVYEYDPATDTWTQKANMPRSRTGLSTSVLDGKTYVIGGHPGSSPWMGLAAVEVYDATTDTWTIAHDIPTGRVRHHASVVNGKIYAIGGILIANAGNYAIGTVEEYDPSLDLLRLVEKSSVNKSYVKAGMDSVCITTKLSDPTNITLLAEIEAPDQTPVDSLELFDDGNHHDGYANDSLFANIWPVSSTEEQRYYFVDLKITRVDTDTIIQQMENVATFTTIGPVVFDTLTFRGSDTAGIPGDRQSIYITLKNAGSTGTATNLITRLISLDSLLTAPDYKRPLDDIAPGETATTSNYFRIEISANCPEPYELPILIQITSNDQLFWTDTCWVYVGTSTVVQTQENSRPEQYALYQNHPNPFNPSTTLRYTIPKSSTVTLTIYDLLGREIALLVNKIQTPGEYSVLWNGQGYPSGIYICHLKAGDFIDARKLVLQK
jgi:N-acetylneuraminic acid mutarotase